MNVEERALERFAELSLEQQNRIRRDGASIGTRVANHVVQVLIGPGGNTADPDTINHASAVTIHANNRLFIATADHVIQSYEKCLKEEPVRFQVGNLLLDPEDRLLWRDDKRDIALLSVQPTELPLIPALTWEATAWPPTSPQIGEYVAFAGHPTHYREDLGPGTVRLNVVGGLMAVTSIGSDNIKCVMPRETLIAIRGGHVPPPGTEMGGMSGGPVFHVVDGRLELVGVITDFGDNFDLFWMATFDGAHL